MFRFSLKSVVCGFAIASAVITLPGCSSHTDTPPPAQPSPLASEDASSASRPRTEAEKAYYNVWGFCPEIYSGSWHKYRLDISPTGEVTAINESFGELLTKAKTEFDKGNRDGKFPPGTPTDFQVALKKECPLGG
jgi:hypothetical protein